MKPATLPRVFTPAEIETLTARTREVIQALYDPRLASPGMPQEQASRVLLVASLRLREIERLRLTQAPEEVECAS